MVYRVGLENQETLFSPVGNDLHHVRLKQVANATPSAGKSELPAKWYKNRTTCRAGLLDRAKMTRHLVPLY